MTQLSYFQHATVTPLDVWTRSSRFFTLANGDVRPMIISSHGRLKSAYAEMVELDFPKGKISLCLTEHP